MSYGWTKKYQSFSWDEFLKMVDESIGLKGSDKVVYFKIIVREEKSWFETRSNLLDDKKEEEPS
jgi:hypothetical protein